MLLWDHDRLLLVALGDPRLSLHEDHPQISVMLAERAPDETDLRLMRDSGVFRMLTVVALDMTDETRFRGFSAALDALRPQRGRLVIVPSRASHAIARRMATRFGALVVQGGADASAVAVMLADAWSPGLIGLDHWDVHDRLDAPGVATHHTTPEAAPRARHILAVRPVCPATTLDELNLVAAQLHAASPAAEVLLAAPCMDRTPDFEMLAVD